MKQSEVDKLCESRLVSNKGKPRDGTSPQSLIQGVGVNDLPHVAKIRVDGKQRLHSGYQQWHGMLRRSYSTKYQERQPTYKDVLVCEEWLKASNFIEWYKGQKKEQGWQLDKDLLIIGNKIYSPETCIFIPPWLNSFTTDSGSTRGDYLIGVSWKQQNSKFQSQCSNPVTGKQESLGYYNSEQEAHQVWKARKLELALELKPKMDDIDLRIYQNVVKIIKSAK